jgi:hypothetical protein
MPARLWIPRMDRRIRRPPGVALTSSTTFVGWVDGSWVESEAGMGQEPDDEVLVLEGGVLLVVGEGHPDGPDLLALAPQPGQIADPVAHAVALVPVVVHHLPVQPRRQGGEPGQPSEQGGVAALGGRAGVTSPRSPSHHTLNGTMNRSTISRKMSWMPIEARLANSRPRVILRDTTGNAEHDQQQDR